MKAEYKKYPLSPNIGNVFLKFAPFLKIYTFYIINYDLALQEVEKQEKKNRKFTEFLEKAMELPECQNLSFSSFLILPIQRIPRYQLLLRDLLDRTPNDHVDYDKIERSLQQIVKVATHCNEGKRRNDITTLKLDLQDYITKNGNTTRFQKILSSSTRKVLLHGILEVSKDSMKSKAKDILGNQSDFYRCYLFQDLILMVPDIVQVHKEKFAQKCELIYLCFAKIISPVNDTRKGKKFLLHAFVKNNHNVYEFVANSEKSAKDWVNTIELQIDKQSNGVDERFMKLPLKRLETKERFVSIEKQLNNAESEFLDGRKKVWSNERYLRENQFEISVLEEEIDNLQKEKAVIMKKIQDITNTITDLRLSFHDVDQILKEIDSTLFRFLNSDSEIFFEVFAENPLDVNINPTEKTEIKKETSSRRLDILGLFNPDKKKRASASATITPIKDKDIERELMTNNRKSIVLSNDIFKKQLSIDEFDSSFRNEKSSRLSFSPTVTPKTFPEEKERPLGTLIGSIKRKNMEDLSRKPSLILSNPTKVSEELKSEIKIEEVIEQKVEDVSVLKKNILNSLPNDPVKLEEILKYIKNL